MSNISLEGMDEAEIRSLALVAKSVRDNAKTREKWLDVVQEANPNLSIPELARKSEISDDAIRLYEKGERAPTWENVQKLAKALGVATDIFRDK